MLTDWCNVFGSTNVQAFAFDSDSKEIIVMFNNNSVYAYKANFIVFEKMKDAVSKGKFVNTTLKPLFTARRIDIA